MDVSSQENGLEYVLLPWDDKTTITVSENGRVTQTYLRWELIQKQLSTSKISNVEDFISVIRSYNVYEKNGQQVKPCWNCLVLRQYFAQLDEFERNRFFEENGVLSTIRNLSLQLKKLVPRLKVLKTGFNSCVRLHQLQIASILSNAFFCTLPKGKANCPSINFNTLYEGSYGSISKYYVEKIKCLIHYFKRIHKKQPTGNLSFHRLNIPDHKFPRWDKTTAGLCSLKVDMKGKIEDQDGFLQMDFANRYVGGGVLGKGCVQEEIRFLISPELIATRLFTECLDDNESLLVVGAERFCHYEGYSKTFAFAGDYEDATPFDEDVRRKTYIIILDALYFHHSSDQYRESKILRELKKAYVGFKAQEEFKDLPLATGNWGCGAFGGDPQLKTILQLMASSQANRDMLYLTFGNFVLKRQIEEFYFFLKKKAVDVGMLYRIIRLYNREKKKNQTVFEFVVTAISTTEARRLTSNIVPSISKEISSASETQFLFSEAKEAKCRKENQQAAERITINSFPELRLGTKFSDKKSSSFKDFPLESYIACTSSEHLPTQKICTFSEDCSSLLDLIWHEDEHDSNVGTKRQREEQPTDSAKRPGFTGNSPSMFPDEEMNMSYEYTEKNCSNDESGNLFFKSNRYESAKMDETENKIIPKVQCKNMVQLKISDYFLKK